MFTVVSLNSLPDSINLPQASGVFIALELLTQPGQYSATPPLHFHPVSTVATSIRVSADCEQVQGGLSHQTLQVLGSDGLYDVCPYPAGKQFA